MSKKIESACDDLLSYMDASRVYTNDELQQGYLGSYSAKRVLMYLLYDGRVVRVGPERFARAAEI